MGVPEPRATVPPGPLCPLPPVRMTSPPTPTVEASPPTTEMPPPMLPGLLMLVLPARQIHVPLPAVLWPTVRMIEPHFQRWHLRTQGRSCHLSSQQMSQSGQQFHLNFLANQRSRLQSGHFPNPLRDRPAGPSQLPRRRSHRRGSAPSLKQRSKNEQRKLRCQHRCRRASRDCKCLLGLKSDRSTLKASRARFEKNRSRAVPVLSRRHS